MDKSWITRSDSLTGLLLGLDEKYSPEFGSSEGVAVYDSAIHNPTMANELARIKDESDLLVVYQAALQHETQPQVAQDIQILISRLQKNIRKQQFGLQREIPYFDAALTIFGGIQPLLDDQTPAERRSAAVMRLRKYAGLENGYRPLTLIIQERVTEQIAKPDMIYPSRQSMEVGLGSTATVMAGIADLCKKYHLSGWEEPFAILKKQVDEYDRWMRKNVLRKAREDFRLPAEEYAINLDGYGIDIPPADLAKQAHAAFTEIQQQMGVIAAQVAQSRHLPSADYRDVIRELKKEQIHGDSIITVYEGHLKDIEDIIRTHQLVTLPNRPAIIRLATAAETSQLPAPHMVPPPFLHNTGQKGVFVLPLNMPAKPGEKNPLKYDDFTFDAAAWTVTAHECRPGHELQFDKMVEEGVSRARALYAFNSTNVEGWGLYSEYIILPYMPLEGQLISLDYRLLRAARAFLDPELQAGTITQAQAQELLEKEVVQSTAFAQEEVQRYTIKMPGQANSYFYGFTKLLALRKDTEAALGSTFNALHFHDFILSQGLLPSDLIRQAVMNDFIPREKQR